MTLDNRAKNILPSLLPSVHEAVQLYREAGGGITNEHTFGIDPLSGNLEMQKIRQDSVLQHYDFNPMFHQLVNGNDSLFKEALLYFVDVTYRLSTVI